MIFRVMQMNYRKHYDMLINRARERIDDNESYTERHHIVPKCMGGTDNVSNLVNLYAREHFVVHQLLVKLYPEINGLVYALVKMSAGKGYHKGRINNRLYNWIKKRNNILKSESKKGKPWSENRRLAYKNNPVVMSAESNEKRRIALIGRKTSTGNLGHKQSEETQLKKLRSNKATLSVWLESPTGQEILCFGINRFARKFNISVSGIRTIINNPGTEYKGWKFLRYSTTEEKVAQNY